MDRITFSSCYPAPFTIKQNGLIYQLSFVSETLKPRDSDRVLGDNVSHVLKTENTDGIRASDGPNNRNRNRS